MTMVGGAQIGVMMEGAESSWIGFPGTTDLDYLKSHGVNLVRLPISWELMQNTINGPLNATYLSGLETFLNEAAQRGMKVIVEVHNHGEYDPTWQQDKAAHGGLFSSAWQIGQPIGSSAVPVSAFTDFWTKLSTALDGHAGVAGYDLMNEPANISISTWQTAAQSAIDAIRAVDTKTPIYAEGAVWSVASSWTQPWYSGTLHLTDPANNMIYEAHQYFDANSSGMYQTPFNAQADYTNMGVDLLKPWIDWLHANNAKGFLGEFGVPVNDPRWFPILNAVLDDLQANGISATYCNYTYKQWAGISISPDNNQGGAVMELIFEHTAPSISGFVPTNGSGSSGTTTANVLSLNGTGASFCTVKVFDNGTLIGTTTSDVSGAWKLATATLANGAHSFSATNIDAAGNSSESSFSLAVTVNSPGVTAPTAPSAPSDTTAPVAPTIASFSNDSGVAGDHITNDNTVTLTGTAAAGSTVKVYDGTTLLGNATANGSGAWSYTTGVLANGAHGLTATATDGAGNTSFASGSLSVTIDTTAPIAPTIASFSNDSGVVGDHITNDNTLTLTGTAAAGSTVKVYDGTTLLGSAIANGSGAWSYTTAAFANGAHNLTANATDAAGNTGAHSTALAVTVDNTTPVVPPTTPVVPTIASFSNDTGVAGDHITSDSTLTLTGTAAANSTVKVYDGTTLLGNATANGGGSWSYTTAALANGTHSLSVTAADVASSGTASMRMMSALAVTAAPAVTANTSVLTIIIDTAAPATPSIADQGLVANHITNDNTLALTGTAEADSTVKLYDGTTLLGSAATNSSGLWSYTTAALIDGAHNLTATATDAAGNTGAHSTALSTTVDTARPPAPTIADNGLAANHITNDNTQTLTGTAEAVSTVKVYDGATLLGNAAANGSGAWSYTTSALANGAHSLTATATDAAGNTGAHSTALAVTVDAANSDHGTGGSGATGGTGAKGGTGTTAPGSIDLWTLGLTDDHTVRDMIGNAVAQNLGNGHLGQWFENHLFAARTLHQLESAMGAGPSAHDSGSTHIQPSNSVSHGSTAGDLGLQDPAAAQLVIGSHPHDKVVGGPNGDVLVVGPGQHTMTGNGGADTFVIGTGHVNTTITDFTPGVDSLEFVGSAGQGNRTAHIREELGNAIVTVGNDHVVLTGVDMHQLQPHDLSNLLV